MGTAEVYYNDQYENEGVVVIVIVYNKLGR